MWIVIGPSFVFDASSDDPDASWKSSTIVVRSNRDRGVIEPRSRRDRAAIVERSMRNQLHDHHTGFREDLQRDRLPIDTRAGHDCGRLR